MKVLALIAFSLLVAGKPGKARPDAGSADAGILGTGALAQPVEVSADKLEILGKEGRAIYSGNAKAVRGTTTITCDELVVSYSSGQEVKRIDALGTVRVADGDRQARGDQAEFDNATGVLTVIGSPEAFQGGNHVSGSRVVFTSGNDVIDVEDARTVVEEAAAPKGKLPVRIDAKRLRIFGQKNKAEWTGKVRARRGTTELSGARVVASYGPDHQLTSLEAHGGAEARDGDRWARGDRADFDPHSGVLVVTGSPEARQGPNRLRGTKVTFLTGTDQLEIENPTSVIHPELQR